MKNTASSATKRKSAGLIQAGGAFMTAHQLGKSQATSVVLRTKLDAQRQHVAIAKLIKMCQASPVVKNASRGITAEVRRDRDRGHE